MGGVIGRAGPHANGRPSSSAGMSGACGAAQGATMTMAEKVGLIKLELSLPQVVSGAVALGLETATHSAAAPLSL